jgi:uncharacterized protein YhhL (DUF1145 family)
VNNGTVSINKTEVFFDTEVEASTILLFGVFQLSALGALLLPGIAV